MIGFTIRELFDAIIKSSLTDKQKVDLFEQLYRSRQITNDLYLIRNQKTKLYQCWHRSKGKKGQTEQILMDYTAEQVVEAYQNRIASKGRKKQI